MQMTIFSADSRGNASNCLYPNRHEVTDADSFARAVHSDHVCAAYKKNYRSIGNFVSSDVLMMDIDNDHTENHVEWITSRELDDLMPDVSYVLVPSRHHMQTKDNYSPRPRFHIYFPIGECTDAKRYAAVKRRLYEAMPFFDGAALDAARFSFGCDDTEIEWHEGWLTIEDYLGEDTTPMEPERMIPSGSRNNTLSRFAGRVLKRFGITDRAHELFLQEAEKCDPPLADTELDTIWASACKFAKRVQAQEGYVPPEEYNADFAPEDNEGWEDPIPFSKFSCTPFPIDAFPEALRDYALALAESTQTPVDMAGVCLLSVLATCIQGKYRIRGKADWIEPLNLYLVSIAKPSERKSAVENGILRPVNSYEEQYNSMNAQAVESSRMRRRLLERKQKNIEDNYAKGKATDEDLEAVCREICEFREMKPLQLYVDDITTEKLAAVLEENHGRAALISTEGGIFDTLAGIYTRGVNIDVMLKAYSGDAIRVDRIGRDRVTVTDPALTIMLMAQPSVMADVLSNKTFRGRGLVARFLFSNPATYVGKREYRSIPVSGDVYSCYERCVHDLLEEETENQIITLSPEADMLIADFATELEPKIETEFAEISDWVGKLTGNILRIAGLLCRASVRRGAFLENDDPLVVSGTVMQNAIRIGKYFLNHAKCVFSVMPENAMVKQAESILAMLLKEGLTEFNRRTAMRNLRAFKQASDIQPVLDFLEDYGYINSFDVSENRGKGRPKLPVYSVHPRLSAYFCPRND